MDPADAVARDPGFLQKAIEGARSAFTHLFEARFSDLGSGDIAGRKRLLRELLEKVRKVRSATEREVWIRELSRVSGVREQALLDEMATSADARGRDADVRGSGVSDVRGDDVALRRIDKICRRLVMFAFYKESFLEKVRGTLELFPGQYRALLEGSDADMKERITMKAAHEFGGAEDALLEEEIGRLLRELQLEDLRERKHVLRTRIRELDGKGKEEESLHTLNEFYVIAKEMDGIKNQVLKK